MTKTRWFALAAVVLFASAFGAAALTQDTAKDPVCGMSVKKDGAKWTFDHQGTTYYFCNEGCKTEFAKNPDKYLAPGAPTKPMGKMMGQGMMHGQMQGQAQAAGTAKDPVCGMSVKKDGAKWTYDFQGTTYYFCSEGCKTEFAKNPDKYLAPGAAAKPMGQMAGHAHAEGEACACQGGCPMMMTDVDHKVETTKDGVVVTLTSKNPETVKKIHEHAARMKKEAGPASSSAKAKEAEGCGGACCAKKK
jgi:YHS domain-containing protein